MRMTPTRDNGEPRRSGSAGFYTLGRRQPVDPEDNPTDEDDNVYDMHSESPWSC